jgi:hypothetical protein
MINTVGRGLDIWTHEGSWGFFIPIYLVWVVIRYIITASRCDGLAPQSSKVSTLSTPHRELVIDIESSDEEGRFAEGFARGLVQVSRTGQSR